MTLNFMARRRPDLKTGGGELMEFICLEDNQYGAAGGITPGTGTVSSRRERPTSVPDSSFRCY